METNKKTLFKVPMLDLQKKYDGRAFNMQINNTGDQPVRVRLFGNGQTFAEVVDQEEQGKIPDGVVRVVTEMPDLSQGLPEGYKVNGVVQYIGATNNKYTQGLFYELLDSGESMPIIIRYNWNQILLDSSKFVIVLNKYTINQFASFLNYGSYPNNQYPLIYWDSDDYKVDPPMCVYYDTGGRNTLIRGHFYEVGLDVGAPRFEYAGTPMRTFDKEFGSNVNLFYKNPYYYTAYKAGKNYNAANFAEGHSYHFEHNKAPRDCNIPVFDYFDLFCKYAETMNNGDKCILKNFKSSVTNANLQCANPTSYNLVLTKVTETVFNAVIYSENNNYIGTGVYTTAPADHISTGLNLEYGDGIFAKTRLFSMDNNDNIYFLSADGQYKYWMNKNSEPGTTVNVTYQAIDETGTSTSEEITLQGNKDTWNFMGILLRITDANGNSFPFDFLNIALKTNQPAPYDFKLMFGGYNDRARNVIWEGDIDYDFIIGLNPILDSEIIQFENIIFKPGCKNISGFLDAGQVLRKNITFENDVKNISIVSATTVMSVSDGYLQNITVTSGDYKDGSDQPQTVTIDRGNNYQTTVGLTTLGVIATKNLMD